MIIDPHQLEAAAKGVGANIGEICRAAKLARSTFTRWKAGENSPTMHTIKKLNAALEKKMRQAA